MTKTYSSPLTKVFCLQCSFLQQTVALFPNVSQILYGNTQLAHANRRSTFTETTGFLGPDHSTAVESKGAAVSSSAAASSSSSVAEGPLNKRKRTQ